MIGQITIPLLLALLTSRSTTGTKWSVWPAISSMPFSVQELVFAHALEDARTLTWGRK